MFDILRKSLRTGVGPSSYPDTPPEVSIHARGRPQIDWAIWKDARPAAAICPTGAIACADSAGARTVTLDLGKCVSCGLCADVDKAIRMTNVSECAARRRDDLITRATYTLNPDGTHAPLAPGSAGIRTVPPASTIQHPRRFRIHRPSIASAHRAPLRPLPSHPRSGRRLLQRLRDRDRRAEQSRLRHRTLWHPLRRLAAARRHASGHRPRLAEHGIGSAQNLRRHARAAPGRGRRRLRLQRRHLRPKLRQPGRRGQSRPGGRLYPRLSAQSVRPAAWYLDGDWAASCRTKRRPFPWRHWLILRSRVRLAAYQAMQGGYGSARETSRSSSVAAIASLHRLV